MYCMLQSKIQSLGCSGQWDDQELRILCIYQVQSLILEFAEKLGLALGQLGPGVQTSSVHGCMLGAARCWESCIPSAWDKWSGNWPSYHQWERFSSIPTDRVVLWCQMACLLALLLGMKTRVYLYHENVPHVCMNSYIYMHICTARAFMCEWAIPHVPHWGSKQ